ncbi:hypothetical protein BGW41_006145 [Actinomortierella wolfii]|nr:hypothetical protein BGW41_006145 [Actinomortierella wolfii]
MVPRAPSIITGIPHEPLIRVSEFIDTYGQHVGGSERKLGDITTTFPPPTFFQDKTRLDATAARCDILDEIEVSNTPFSDPTLFGLLKEWHDFLVTKAHPHHEREEAARKAKGVRPTWKSVHGRPGEGTDIGGSGSHAIGDGSREDEEVEESAEEEEGINENHTREGYARRAHERRPVATRIFLKTANMMADATSDQAVETSTSKSQRFTSDSHSAPASESAASATAFSRSGQKSSRMPRRDSPTSAGTTESSFSTSAQRQPRIPPVSNISIIQEQNMQRLQDYLTPAQGEDAEDTSAFLKTAIEVNIEKLMKGIASSPLASLNVDQRFEVPTSERPPINFRNISLPAVRSPPYRAITDPNEVVVTVAIQSNTHPSRRMQEVKLLGSNTLLDLRNAFMCPSDFTLQGHDEPPEGHPQQNTATRKASSSMFCIESCFYIDNPYLHAKADKKRAIVEQEQDRQIRLKHQTLMRRREAERKQREARNNDHASSSQNNSNMLLDTDVLELERELDNVPPTVFLPMEKMEIENEEELKSISEDYST